MKRRRLLQGLCVAAVLLIPQMAWASSFAASPPVQVSGASPVGEHCGLATRGPTSHVFRDSEVEPWIDVNPANGNNIVGSWQQDRWSDGGARGLVSAYSRDGGRTWARTAWPVSRCAAGGLGYERATDPWVSTGPEGVVYGSALSFDATTPRNAVVAITSYDGSNPSSTSTPSLLLGRSRTWPIDATTV